jgi:hypothetical protein
MRFVYEVITLSLEALLCSDTLLNKKAVTPHAMEALGGEEIQLLLILDLGTRWG